MTAFSQFRAQGHPQQEAEPRLTDEARRVQGDRAGMVTRAIAAVIDVALVAGFTVGGYFAAALAEFLMFPGVTIYKPNPLVFFGIGYFLMWAYWTVSWATSGKPLGNRLMGLRVVGRRSPRLGWGAAAIRSFLCILFPPGLLWVAVSRQNRSLQDVVVRTSAVYDWRSRR